MATGFASEIFLSSEDETTAFGRDIAPHLQAGDVLLLSGPIGAGKTHFARAVIQSRLAAVGRAEDVPSPTFTLVQIYDDGVTELWHADLYRLTDPQEVFELGLDDAFDTGIVLIEWPDRLGDAHPPGALHIAFSGNDDTRHLSLTSTDPRWEQIVPQNAAAR